MFTRQLKAKLVRASDSAPLAGQLLRFSAGGVTVCEATTNAAGEATCTSRSAYAAALVNGGYNVDYAGSTTYEPASAAGTLA